MGKKIEDASGRGGEVERMDGETRKRWGRKMGAKQRKGKDENF